MKWKTTPPGNISNLTHVFGEVTQCPLPEFLLPFSSQWEDGKTCYLFISGSGERENRFLGPVRACIAFQTSSFLLISVSRGSKPYREESREGQACRREWGQGRSALLLCFSQVCPFGSPSLDCRHMLSVPTLQEPTKATLLPRGPTVCLRLSCKVPSGVSLPPLVPRPLTSKGSEKSSGGLPKSPARVQRKMKARHSSSTAIGHSAISWE